MKLNLINYIGGKSYMLDKIIPLLDYSKKCYIELFGGSGKVLLNKPEHKIELYNDINLDLYYLFKALIEKPDEFIRAIENYPYHEQIFKDLKNDESNDLIKRAIKTFYIYNCTFNCNYSSLGYSFIRDHALTFENKKKKLNEIIKRLKSVQILNRDYKDILESIKDKTDIMLYADPPYYSTEYYYNGGFNKDDHYKLAEYLNNANYSVMISYYEFDEIKNLYPESKWRYYEFEQVKYSYGVTKNSKNKSKPKSKELLLLNYKVDSIINL